MAIFLKDTSRQSEWLESIWLDVEDKVKPMIFHS